MRFMVFMGVVAAVSGFGLATAFNPPSDSEALLLFVSLTVLGIVALVLFFVSKRQFDVRGSWLAVIVAVTCAMIELFAGGAIIGLLVTGHSGWHGFGLVSWPAWTNL